MAFPQLPKFGAVDLSFSDALPFGRNPAFHASAVARLSSFSLRIGALHTSVANFQSSPKLLRLTFYLLLDSIKATSESLK